MGGYNSACFERARGDVLILANDDMVIRTSGWDDRIRAMKTEFDAGEQPSLLVPPIVQEYKPAVLNWI
jgi:hypothetical protein